MNPKVFYINLDRDLDRNQHMETMLAELGFDYERVPAVEGAAIDLSEYYDDTLAKEKNGSSLTPAEIGCAASHRAIYRRIVHEQLPYTLIFEDDITVVQDFKQLVYRVIAKNLQRSSWDYLTFDYAESGTIFLKRWFSSAKLHYQRYVRGRGPLARLGYIITVVAKLALILPLTYFESIRNAYYKKRRSGTAVSFLRPLYFTGCYLITLEGARKLLQLSEPRIIYPSDRLPNQARRSLGLRFRAYAPISAKQLRRRFGSNIGIDADFDETYKETEL